MIFFLVDLFKYFFFFSKFHDLFQARKKFFQFSRGPFPGFHDFPRGKIPCSVSAYLKTKDQTYLKATVVQLVLWSAQQEAGEGEVMLKKIFIF